jgi:hypothetical protein
MNRNLREQKEGIFLSGEKPVSVGKFSSLTKGQKYKLSSLSSLTFRWILSTQISRSLNS